MGERRLTEKKKHCKNRMNIFIQNGLSPIPINGMTHKRLLYSLEPFMFAAILLVCFECLNHSRSCAEK